MADPVFVDDVTPLNAANMNKLQTRDEEGQPNGYASLGSDGKVPAGQLPTPAPAGADLSYDGDWVAGTYQDGDVVVKDGIAYLCVGGPTVVAPDPTPWGLAVPAPPGAPVTVLPGSAVDGQLALLTDASVNFMWQLRYMAAWGSEKWAYIGGMPALTDPTGTVTVTTPGVYNVIAGAQNLVFPRTGWYHLRATIWTICTAFVVVTTSMLRFQRSVSGPYAPDRQIFCHPMQYAGGRAAVGCWINGVAGETLSMQVGLQGAAGSTVYFGEAQMELTPYALS